MNAAVARSVSVAVRFMVAVPPANVFIRPSCCGRSITSRPAATSRNHYGGGGFRSKTSYQYWLLGALTAVLQRKCVVPDVVLEAGRPEVSIQPVRRRSFHQRAQNAEVASMGTPRRFVEKASEAPFI